MLYELERYKVGDVESEYIRKAKAKSETGKIIKFSDDDVTTYLFELPEWYECETNGSELVSAIIERFNLDLYAEEGLKGTLCLEEDDDILYLYFDSPTKDEIGTFTLVDEDGDTFEYMFIKREYEKFWLHHRAFIDTVAEQILYDFEFSDDKEELKNKFINYANNL